MQKVIKTEYVHLPSLKYIVAHTEQLGVQPQTAALAQALLRRCKPCDGDAERGAVTIAYTTFKGFGKMQVGRWQAERELGLQGMWCEIRAAVAGRYYWDVDVVNAQPTLLLQVAERSKWPCDRLRRYVVERDVVLAHAAQVLGVEGANARNTAKTALIAVLYGSQQFAGGAGYLAELTQELTVLRAMVERENPALVAVVAKRKGDGDHSSSVMAYFLQTEERKVLMAVEGSLTRHGRHMDTYIHDGGLVRKLDGEAAFPADLLPQLQADVKVATGYSVTLAVKPMVGRLLDGVQLTAAAAHEPPCQVVDESVSWMQHDDAPFMAAAYLDMKRRFEEQHFYLERDATVCRMHTAADRLANPHDGPFQSWASRQAIETIGNRWMLQYEVPGHRGETMTHKAPFMPLWLKDPSRRSVRGVVFEPDVARVPAEYLNLFTGPVAASMSKGGEGAAGLQRFLDLTGSLMKHNAEHVEWLLNYAAHMMQRPAELPGVAVVFYSAEHGIGKDTWFEVLGSVLGDGLFLNTGDAERDVFGEFALLGGRLLVKMEEAAGFANRKNASKLKALITAGTVVINRKGKQAFSTASYHRLCMTSNESVCVRVEQGDRRFATFSVGGVLADGTKLKGNHDWWTETHRLFRTARGVRLPDAA